MENNKSIYDFSAKLNNGKTIKISDYKGKLLLVVNTASKCGFTKQYEGLQNLYNTYKDKGLEILAFPCNQFGAQEPGTSEEISNFCKMNYGVTFPIFEKIDVNGENAHPLFKFLAAKLPGILNTKFLKWNFTKFLIAKDGTPLERYSPSTTPENLEKDIQKLLS